MPLHLASSRGDAETVRLLIEHGADVNARDGGHSTPLHLILSLVSVEAVRLFTEHWADVVHRLSAGGCRHHIRGSCSY